MPANVNHPIAQRPMRKTVLVCSGIVAAMIGAAYASVPLYNLFCRITGFDGTPRFAAQKAARVGDRTLAVQFDANVAPGLPWRFVARTARISLKPGETQTIVYSVRNNAADESTGRASYNVEPKIAAQYFNKLECFCEIDTPLKAGETREASVVFFLDPALENDPDMKNIDAITLSYTFFPSKSAKPLAAAPAGVAMR